MNEWYARDTSRKNTIYLQGKNGRGKVSQAYHAANTEAKEQTGATCR